MNRLMPLRDQVQTFIQEIEKLPGVEKASNSTMYPGEINNNNGYQIKGRDRAKTYLFITNWADYDFAETYDIPLVEGRYLSRDFSSDSSACVINQAAVRDYALEDPLSTLILMPGNDGESMEFRVIGVLKDYHLTSLRSEIKPAVTILKPPFWMGGYGSIKLSGEVGNIKNTMKQIEGIWHEFAPGEPFLYLFLDEHFRDLYNEEIRTGRISITFSVLAVLIAVLGLFGLTLFNTEKKTREIGIRKVMGARESHVVFIILKEILILLSISTLIAWVVSYFVMTGWIQDFPYRIEMGPGVFLISAAIAFVISIVTVGIQALKAARQNPADILHYE